MAHPNDVKALQKQIDMYGLRMRRTKSRIHDLEIELGRISPRKRAESVLFDVGRAKYVRLQVEQLQEKVDATDDTIALYRDIFGRFGEPLSDKEVFRKKEKKNRMIGEHDRPKLEVPRKRRGPTLPPIAITNFKYGEEREVYPEYAKSTDALFRRYFDTEDPELVVRRFDEMRTENARLRASMNATRSDMERMGGTRSALLDELACQRGVRMTSDRKKILAEYAMLLAEKEKEVGELKAKKELIKKMAKQIARMCQVDNEADDYPVGSLIRDVAKAIKQGVVPRETQSGGDDMPPLALSDDPKEMKSKSTRSCVTMSTAPPAVINGTTLQSVAEEGEDNSASRVEFVVPVPLLNLGRTSRTSEFFPGTRSTRRALSSISPLPPLEGKVVKSVNTDLDTVGVLLGNIFVEVYASELHVMSKDVEDDLPCELPDVDVSGNTTELMDVLYKKYVSRSDNISLLLFNASEVRQKAASFLEVFAIREKVVESLKTEFDVNEAVRELRQMFRDNVVAAIWVIRDLWYSTIGKPNFREVIMRRMNPSFVYIISNMASLTQSKSEEIIALTNCLAAYLETDNNATTVDAISRLIGESYDPVIAVFAAEKDETAQRVMTSIFTLGQWLPYPFQACVSLTSNKLPIAQTFLEMGIQFPTFVRAACNLIGAMILYMDKECVMWHTAYLFHLFVRDVHKSVIRSEVLVPVVSALTVIVENRRRGTVEQFVELNILQHLMRNVELETCLVARPDAHLPAPSPIHGVPSPMSYLDIPKLAMPLQLPSLNLDNPKLQLHFQPQGQSNMRKSMSITDTEYFHRRKCYPIYASDDLHTAIIHLFFATIIDQRVHRLDVTFCDPFPQVNRKPNVLFTLIQHMEGAFNITTTEYLEEKYAAPEVPRTLEETRFPTKSGARYDEDALTFKSQPNFGRRRGFDLESESPRFVSDEDQLPFRDYDRILRLMVPSRFNRDDFANGTHIASGAFGAVMSVMHNSKRYAVKVLEKSASEFDNPHLIEVFTEVSILEICKGDRRVTQIFDYGCSSDSYYIVMEFYPTTLRGWRKMQKKPSLPQLLRVYREFLHSATVLTDRRINHFDIKCDNVMLDIHGMPALADFGEAMSYDSEHNCRTMLNRGTEWVKSPEMLSIALDSATTDPNYDRRRKVGAGPASDVWSIGCLFYELITGEYLFADSDWSRFFLRITSSKHTMLTKACLSKLPRDDKYRKFLQFVLERHVRRRPNLAQVIMKFDETFPDARNGSLPRVVMPSINEQH